MHECMDVLSVFTCACVYVMDVNIHMFTPCHQNVFPDVSIAQIASSAAVGSASSDCADRIRPAAAAAAAAGITAVGSASCCAASIRPAASSGNPACIRPAAAAATTTTTTTTTTVGTSRADGDGSVCVLRTDYDKLCTHLSISGARIQRPLCDIDGNISSAGLQRPLCGGSATNLRRLYHTV
jgi:hypothetical protein